ncbi:hypothetical protein E4U52_001555 [Claviceps spartinae]|nr:hypothetical protein E4U52_001555 [Claviceps spartinae]
MVPKPPSGASGGSGPGGRSNVFRQKMARVHTARHIPAQPADAALKDGQLDLQAFLKAHEFEVNALQQSMATSKAVSSSRAFQQVPRGLRRRTASHNPKRVPRRLRAKAKREMQDDNTPTVESRNRRPRTTRARIRAELAKRRCLLAARKRRRLLKKPTASEPLKDAQSKETSAAVDARIRAFTKRQPRPTIRRNVPNDPPQAPARFRKRQINKTWLPTHKWHAKRARMTQPTSPLWRFAIPLTPNEKIYRATHRAQGERGTLAWDTSYMSTIGLYGNPVGIEKILKSMGVTQESCWNEKGRKWTMGTRAWSGLLSRPRGASQTRWICPATVVWNPQVSIELPTDTPNSGKQQRQALIRLNPAAFLETFTELVRLCKAKHSGVFVEDLRFEIGSIELTGPASTETLLGTMTAYNNKSHPKNKHAGLFEALKTVTNPASLPANAVLGFSIQDPRLRYPPRKMDVSTTSTDGDAGSDLMELLATWPAEEGLEPYALFDRYTRFRATCLPSQAAISKRKSLTTPGSFLKPSQLTDPPIPVILIASRSPESLLSQGTWTLLMPWKCLPSLWYSIVHCPLMSGWNPRFGGLNESMQVAFERGMPWFPRDYIATDAGAAWELEERKKRAHEHEKRPKSKRIAYSALDLGAGRKGEVGNGHACDFELLFGLSRQSEDDVASESSGERIDAEVSPDTEPMDIDQQGPQQPVSTPIAQEESTADSTPPTTPLQSSSLTLLNALTKADFLAMTRTTNKAPLRPLPPNAIINVRLTLLSGGNVTNCARIYRLPSSSPPAGVVLTTSPALQAAPPQAKPGTLPPDLRAQWLAQLPSRNNTRAKPSARGRSTQHAPPSREQLLAQSLIAAPESDSVTMAGHPLVPDAEDLIGFVTTGSYCLRDGKASAQGSLAVEKIVEGVRADPREGCLCVVRDVGRQVGWLARWEV